MGGSDEDFEYPVTQDILNIHEVIVESNEDTESGVRSLGAVEYAIESIREGHFGEVPRTIHEKAHQLMRLLVANHPFVDGNKRTALASVVVLYALNDYDLAYDAEIKGILKQFGTDESQVEESTVVSYLREHTRSLPAEYRSSYELLGRLFRSEARHVTGDAEGNDYTHRNTTDG